jgi:hypothetical protein
MGNQISYHLAGTPTVSGVAKRTFWGEDLDGDGIWDTELFW